MHGLMAAGCVRVVVDLSACNRRSQMIVDKLPEIATNVSKPLMNTKEMVFVSSNGSGPSQLTGDITKMMAQIPATVHGLTGVVCLPALPM